MDRIRKAYVDLPRGQVHCRIREGVEPTLVLLHQTASSSASFDPLMRELAIDHRIVAIDTPGFGGSYDPSGMPSLGDYAAQIVATLDRLGADRFHLFGHHTGASLAIEIAATVPVRVESVMLAGPVFMTDAERIEFAAGYDQPIAPSRDGAHLLANWNYAATYNPDCDVELLHGEVVAMLRAWRGRPQAYAAVAHHDTAAAAAKIGAPVLLLTSPDDFFHFGFDRARAIFPRASVATTSGGNFQPAADAPGTARATEGFLASRRE